MTVFFQVTDVIFQIFPFNCSQLSVHQMNTKPGHVFLNRKSVQNTTEIPTCNWYNARNLRAYLVSLHLIFVPTFL